MREVLLFYKAGRGGEMEKLLLKWELLQHVNIDRNDLKEREKRRIQGIEGGNIMGGVLD